MAWPLKYPGLIKGQGLVAGHTQLQLDEIKAGDLLAHGVLDLRRVFISMK
jgi:hypothetical protein